jgi:hypothetical protein
MTELDENRDLTFTVTKDLDGFVVNYIDSTGSQIWSEFFATMDEIKLVYRQDIAAGRFDDAL